MIGVAFSGGPDSLALLLLAREIFGEKVKSATIDHQLRPESASESRYCALICAKLGLNHTNLRVNVPSGNLQANARAARYQALGEWCEDVGIATILTAHHADDQAETLLMRLNRGSGLSGLSGIRSKTHLPGHSNIALARPLLDWRKAELEQIVADAGLEPVRDPSNADERFDRARIRKALAQADWLNAGQVSQSAQHLQEVEHFLDRLAREEWDAHVSEQGEAISYAFAHHPERVIALRIIQRAAEQLGGKSDMATAAHLHKALIQGESANAGGILARARKDAWHFSAEPARRS